MRQVVLLHTDWCGACRQMLEDFFLDLKEERPEQVLIENITAYSPIVGKLKPTKVPTIVFTEDGDEFYRIACGVTREFVEDILDGGDPDESLLR